MPGGFSGIAFLSQVIDITKTHLERGTGTGVRRGRGRASTPWAVERRRRPTWCSQRRLVLGNLAASGCVVERREQLGAPSMPNPEEEEGEKEEEILRGARQLASRLRSAFLDERCGNDLALRQRI